MKILIIMGGYFPGKKYGGPPVSVDNFCTLMMGYADCYIVTHNHDMGENEPYDNINRGWNDRGNSKVIYVDDNDYCSKTFESVIREIQPDYIYLQGLFQQCVLPCLKLAKKYSINVILAPRGELCSGAFKKKYKKIPYIAVLRMLKFLKDVEYQSTSEEETFAICRYLGAEMDRVHYLTNIPSIPKNLKKKEEKKIGCGKFVFISRILWKKNLIGAIDYLKNINGEVQFDIYGPKEDEKYWTECEKAIQVMPSNIKIQYKGLLSHDDIHETFNKYDALLFPTFSENYGHVIAEALMSNCIPIISDQTPWNDLNNFRAGWAIPLNNEEWFTKALQEVVDMDEDSIQSYRNSIKDYIEKKLCISSLKEEYLCVFK